jgi:hypothetical protein
MLYSCSVRSCPPGAKHQYVEDLAWVRCIAIRKHRLDNQDPAAGIHRTPTVAEDS